MLAGRKSGGNILLPSYFCFFPCEYFRRTSIWINITTHCTVLADLVQTVVCGVVLILEALQSCAGSEGWTKPVANAWWDVMSFAILAVVERTVESWGSSHGMSLSEV